MKHLKIALLVMTLGLMSFSEISNSKAEILKLVTSSVSWKDEAIDVGEIPQGIPKIVEFELKNTGSVPVIIIDAKSSCGCTIASYQKEPILPGNTGIVSAKYNAFATGAFTKTITVNTTADQTSKTLIFKGIVTEK